MSTGNYIPPSRRPGYVAKTTDLPSSSRSFRQTPPYLTGVNVHTLSSHFTHPQGSTLTFFSYPFTRGPNPQRPSYNPTRTPENTPLPPSPPPPPPIHPLNHLVSYICIFPNAHPAWKSDGQLWLHTNAQKMMEDWNGEKKNFGRPIPVFEASMRGSREYFAYQGWWIINGFEVVEARSDALKAMLQAKEDAKSFSRVGRTPSAWASSFSHPWIKLHLFPVSPSHPHQAELKDPMSIPGGPEGEVERYILELGNLNKEIEILKDLEGERREMLKEADLGSRCREA